MGGKGAQYPRAWGTLGDQAPAPSFALRLGAEPWGKVHKLIPGHCTDEETEKNTVTHRVRESQDWALGLWPICPGGQALRGGAIHSVPLWPSEESMHRWSPHCALGWLQAELEEAEQEAEVRGGEGGLGTGERPILSLPHFILTLQAWQPLLQEA